MLAVDWLDFCNWAKLREEIAVYGEDMLENRRMRSQKFTKIY
jgi:hypothetical protein